MKLENSFNRVYPFTTENISGYIDQMDLSGKSVITVGSSLDQAFNAELFGAKNITVFDINTQVEKYYELKKAAVIELKREEFINFLMTDFLNKKMYSKVRDYMKYSNEDITDFWDHMVINDTNKEKFFSKDILPMETIIKSNPYLQNDVLYNNLKMKLLTSQFDINIKSGDIFNLNKYLKKDECYDRMIFSNVISYIQIMHNKEDIYNYIKKSFIGAKNHLNENGLLQFLYLYSFSAKDVNKNDSEIVVENLFSLWRVLNTNGLNVNFFDSVTENETDAILTYVKK